MVKMQFTNEQTALSYAIYMIAGSYFAKTKCNNLTKENSLRLQFLEQKPKDQYLMEDACIRYVEEKLLPFLPKDVWSRDVQVRMIAGADGAHQVIQFLSPKYALCIHGDKRGKKITLSHELWRKQSKEANKKFNKKSNKESNQKSQVTTQKSAA